MLDADELLALDDFRFKKRMPSRASAVRELLKRGLAAERAPLLVVAGAWLAATVTVAFAEEGGRAASGFRLGAEIYDLLRGKIEARTCHD